MRVGWTVGKLAARRLLKAKVGDRDIALGDALTEQLDQMKGLSMKLGQIVSYMDVPLPDVVQQRMARLQMGVRGMSEEETRAALRDALGEGFEERFEAFDIVPFAAASIGQVHRARFQGQDIALKLQYPQVARGFEDDLNSVGRFASLASLASAVDGKAIVRELAERLDEECDYEKEARSQSAFRQAFQSDREILVAEVIEPLTTRATLGTVWAEGHTYQEAAKWPQEVRTRLAHALLRFNYGSLLARCAIQADPHPGNFKFTPEGRVVCLDFGCVRCFDVAFIEQLREMIAALDSRDHPRFRESIIALGMAPRPDKFDFEHYFSMMEHLHTPLLADSFHFDADFVKAGLAFNGPSNPNARTMNMPPAYIWVARLQWGLWSLLARLDVRIEARELFQEIIRAPLEPLLAHDPWLSSAAQ